MDQKEIQFKKKREFGEIVSDSFEFLRQEYPVLLKLIIIYVLPFLILYGYVQVNIQMKFIGAGLDLSDPESMMSKIGPIYLNAFVSTLFALFVQSLLASTFYSYVELYVKKGKGNFEFSEITSLLFSNGLLAIGANLILYVIVAIGVIMCILPGIYFANTFSLVLMIVIFEKKGIGDGFTKSWALVNSQWWGTFLLNILALLIIWVAGFIISIPTMLTGTANTIFGLQESGAVEQPSWYWFAVGATTVISSVFYIVVYTFLAFHYFNLNERFSQFLPPTRTD